MIVYVQRNAGVITGVYKNRQVGIADEAIDNAVAEVVAFHAKVNSDPDVPKVTAFRAAVQQAITDMATYKALANPSAAQRLAWERRMCDVLTAMMKRLTQTD